MQRASRWVCLWWLSFAWTAARAEPPELQRFEHMEVHMGTKFHIALYASDEASAKRGFEAAFARIGELNAKLSDYLADSELSKLSRSSPHGRGVPVSDELWYMLSEAQRLSERSDGAFDITVGPLTKLWRRARRQREAPRAELLAEAQAAVGYPFMELDRERQEVRLTKADMRLDLGGIAKGYAAQQALAALREVGISRALVEGGGDLAVSDPPPGEPSWRIAVAPLEPDAEPTRYLRVSDQGVATSGDYWQFIEIEGQRYSHILDPRTGLGVTRRSSVTVVAGDGETADALASALSVLEPARGLELLKAYPGAEALIVVEEAGAPREYISPGFSKLVEPAPRLTP